MDKFRFCLHQAHFLEFRPRALTSCNSKTAKAFQHRTLAVIASIFECKHNRAIAFPGDFVSKRGSHKFVIKFVDCSFNKLLIL